jgi:hypothetical protein
LIARKTEEGMIGSNAMVHLSCRITEEKEALATIVQVYRKVLDLNSESITRGTRRMDS